MSAAALQKVRATQAAVEAWRSIGAWLAAALLHWQPISNASDPALAYAAFISYRHVEPDRRWAHWLHAQLERYRVPRRLARDRALPRRVGRVFRDEEELAASPHLSKDIEDALRRSERLIIVCSPNASASKWVNAEVKFFRGLGRADKILTLLIDGEPATAFPPSLLEIRSGATAAQAWPLPDGDQPLAADVRPIGSEPARHRRRMAKLRLLAAVLGCRFDDLRRREQERRNALLAFTTAASLAFVLLLGGLTVWSEINRRAAESSVFALRSDAVRASAPEVALDLAVQAYDRKATAEAQGAVRRSIDQVALLRIRKGLHSTTASGGGARLAALDETGRIHVFDAETLDEIGSLPAPKSPPSEIALSATGRFLAAADGSATVQVWDLASDWQARTITAEHQVDAVRFGQAEVVLAAIGDDEITFFELPRLKRLSTSDKSVVGSQSIAFSPSDDRVVLVGSENEATVVDTATGRDVSFLDLRDEAAALRPSLGGSDAGLLQSAYFSHDGESIITSGGHAVWHLWNATSGELLTAARWTVPMGAEWLLQLPDDATIITGFSGSGELAAWKLRDGSTAETFVGKHDNLVYSGALRPQGGVIATKGADNVVALWSVTERRQLATYHSALPAAHNIAFAPSGERLVTFGPYGPLALWDATMVAPIGRLANGAESYRFASLSLDVSRVVTLGFKGKVTVWDAANLRRMRELTGSDGRISQVAISPDGTRIATVGDHDAIQIWDAEQGTEVARISGKADYVSFDPSGSKIGVSDFDGHVRVIAVEDGRVLSETTFHQNLTNAVIFSPDTTRYVVTGNDGTAIVAAIDTGEAVQTISVAGVPFRRAAFGPQGDRLFTTHDDNVVRGWDIGTGQMIAEFRGHLAGVSSLHVSLDGRLLLSFSDDDTVRLWNAEDGVQIRTVATHGEDVLDARFAGAAGVVLSVDRDGYMYRSRCQACLGDTTLLDRARSKLEVLKIQD